MPIRVRLPEIDLAPINELIQARRLQWNEVGTPQSLALNKSGILIISALLQGHIEEVYVTLCRFLLRHIKEEELEQFRRSIGIWGNPSAENINRLFGRIGVMNIIDNITWQKMDGMKIKARLNLLNERRNRIAHGKALEGSLKLAEIENTRDFIEQFAQGLNRHLYRRFRGQLAY
jgi:hypothetical protein